MTQNANPETIHLHRAAVEKKLTTTLAYPVGEVREVQPPHPALNLQNFLNCVFAKYTVQALLLYSLNPEFSTGKR